MTFFFCINQDLADGSAHALYCYRHCRAMAMARPEARVVLLHCGTDTACGFGQEAPPNLTVTRLFAVRRRKGGRGVTLNFVYYWSLLRHLRRHVRDGDVVCTAGFLKLGALLFKPGRFGRRVVRIYDSHQDMLMEHGPGSKQEQSESRVFAWTDLLLTTTGPMLESMRRRFPTVPSACVGLACGYSPEAFLTPATRTAGAPFTLSYVGSFYGGQGVDWLVRAWAALPPETLSQCHLMLIGGGVAEVSEIRALADELGLANVTVQGRLPAAKIPQAVAGADALVIPSLPEGRMPYVAITKAYDYLAMRRPMLVADLPSITEVVRPGVEGFSFRAGDAKDFARAFAELLANPETGAGYAASAVFRVRDFDWETRSRAIWASVDAASSRL